nr:MAG TPA: docking protein 2 [Caudoviricetes sp.]
MHLNTTLVNIKQIYLWPIKFLRRFKYNSC